YGRWTDSTETKDAHYAVLRPAGGGRAELIRTPQFTLTLIGPAGGDALALHQAADAVVEAMRAGSGDDLVFLQPAEPVFVPTDDGRAVLEIAISAITH
ncbi:MAG: hypothetical protein RLZZ524_2444, partial [Pseudomonadota bacterium]